MSEQGGGLRRRGLFVGGLQRFLAVSAAVLLVSSCRVEGLAFRHDKRLEIVSPSEHAMVVLPVTVQWKVSDFQVTGPNGSAAPGRGHFGVFVDTDPPGPGKSLRSLAGRDSSCKVTPGCPDDRWFAARGVHTTTATSFRVDSLSDNRPFGRPRSLDRHEVTVVLLNGRSERIGESSVAVEFFVQRRSS